MFRLFVTSLIVLASSAGLNGQRKVNISVKSTKKFNLIKLFSSTLQFTMKPYAQIVLTFLPINFGQTTNL